MTVDIRVGDCLEVMPTMDAASVDAIVTDPPYGLAFMGKGWDHAVPGEAFWREALRVAKPGAHLVAFGGTRTYHRLTCAIEDAGWEIRDCLSWLYGSGFPKSHNGPWGGTALKPGWEPIVLARKPLAGTVEGNHAKHGTGALNIDGCRLAALTDAEVARSGKSGGIFSREGSAGIDWKRDGGNDKGRWPANVVLDEQAAGMLDEQSGERPSGGHDPAKQYTGLGFHGGAKGASWNYEANSGGASRFFFVSKGVCKCGHANTVAASSSQPSHHVDSARSDAVTPDRSAGLPIDPSPLGQGFTGSSPDSTPTLSRAPSADSPASIVTTPTTPTYCESCGCALRVTDESTSQGSEARAAGVNVQVSGTRFWYSAKASRSERNAGLESFADRRVIHQAQTLNNGSGGLRNGDGLPTVTKNHHPTVKPLDLMQWLCRLVTPKGGLILDPFTGSGSTGRAAVAEGFRFIGIELSEEYAAIARARIAEYAPLFAGGAA